MRVSAAGGTPATFGALSPGATRQRWPQALPGGQAVLYSEHSTDSTWDAASLVVAPLSGLSAEASAKAGGVPKVVVRGGYYGRYVPSGHLIYLQQTTLFAVRFDLTRLETVGQAVPALEGVAANPDFGTANLAVSSEGTLVYLPGTATAAARSIEWLTRDGKTAVLRAANADWANPRFSPDGQKLAIETSESVPMFSPDGRWIAYTSNETGSPEAYVRPFPGPGGPWRISTTGGLQARWSATAPELLFVGPQATIMAAPYAVVGGSFRADTPRIWSPTGIQGVTSTNTPYDVHPDGQRVATAAAPEQANSVQDKVVFVFNFGDYLRTIAPGNK